MCYPIYNTPRRERYCGSVNSYTLRRARNARGRCSLLGTGRGVRRGGGTIARTTRGDARGNSTCAPNSRVFQKLPPLSFLNNIPTSTIVRSNIATGRTHGFIVSGATHCVPGFVHLSGSQGTSFGFVSFFFPYR